MRKFLALLSLALLTTLTLPSPVLADWSLTPAEKTTFGVAVSYTQIGHERGVPRRWAPDFTCLDAEPIIEIVNLVSVSQEKADAFSYMAAGMGLCRYFPAGLIWWPDEIVTRMKWSDGDPIYVVKGHAWDQDPVYIWIPVSKAEELGFPVPGATLRPVGLGI